MTYVQAVEKVNSYDENELRSSVDLLLRSLEVEKDLYPGISVLIKPNLLGEYNPWLSVTTNPMLVKTVSEWLLNHGVKKVVIADSPGGSVCMMPDFSFTDFYKKANYDFLGEIPGVVLNTDKSWRPKATPGGCVLESYNLLSAVCDADYIINIPKLKTHIKTGISIGVKNLFGCIPDLQKPAFHARYPKISDFATMLVELALTVKPSITIVDAIEIMEHNGPVMGDRRHLGLLFGAKDVFSQDDYIAGLLGIEQARVDLLRVAREKGLIKRPEVKSTSFSGEEPVAPLVLPDNFTITKASDRVSFFFSMGKKKLSEMFLSATPEINVLKCKQCMRCYMSCPVGAISNMDDYPKIDVNKCIHCLCCSEVCVHDSIKIKNRIKRRTKE